MKRVILNVLCEGQTETEFAKRMLAPYLRERTGIITKVRTLITSHEKKSVGGISNFNQVKNDLNACCQEASVNSKFEVYWYTTMLDFYGLPSDFPAYLSAIQKTDHYESVAEIEQAMKADLSFCPHLIPYIQLHEFEALVFCGLEYLQNEYPRRKKEIQELSRVLESHEGNPELINHGANTAPSKRILQAIEKKKTDHYNKPKMGVEVTKSVGIDRLMERCPHFKDWVEKLLDLQRFNEDEM